MMSSRPGPSNFWQLWAHILVICWSILRMNGVCTHTCQWPEGLLQTSIPRSSAPSSPDYIIVSRSHPSTFLIRREANETADMHNHPEIYGYTFDHANDRPKRYHSTSMRFALIRCSPSFGTARRLKSTAGSSGCSSPCESLLEVLAHQHVIKWDDSENFSSRHD
jgi:hypothetical protein